MKTAKTTLKERLFLKFVYHHEDENGNLILAPPFVDDFEYKPIGVWNTPVEGKLEVCVNGYHVIDVSAKALGDWIIENDHVYLCEVSGSPKEWVVSDDGDNKTAVRNLRFLREIVPPRSFRRESGDRANMENYIRSVSEKTANAYLSRIVNSYLRERFPNG